METDRGSGRPVFSTRMPDASVSKITDLAQAWIFPRNKPNSKSICQMRYCVLLNEECLKKPIDCQVISFDFVAEHPMHKGINGKLCIFNGVQRATKLKPFLTILKDRVLSSREVYEVPDSLSPGQDSGVVVHSAFSARPSEVMASPPRARQSLPHVAEAHPRPSSTAISSLRISFSVRPARGSPDRSTSPTYLHHSVPYEACSRAKRAKLVGTLLLWNHNVRIS